MRKLEKYKMIRENKHYDWKQLDSFGKTTAEQLNQANVLLFRSVNPIKIYGEQPKYALYIMPMKGYKPLKEFYVREEVDVQNHLLLVDAVLKFVLDRIDSKVSVQENSKKRSEYRKNLKEQYSHINFKETHDWALRVSKKAVEKALEEHGEPELACGFAWVNVHGVRQNSKLGKQLEKLGYSWSHYEKSYSIWKPADYNGQCIMIHEAGASAYAQVLSKAGIKATSSSRLD